MTPKEFHEACYEAICECPQFRGYDDDTMFVGYGEFGDLPKKGWRKLIQFWKQEHLLWDMGYSKALPQEVQDLFDQIDTLFYEAIATVMQGKK